MAPDPEAQARGVREFERIARERAAARRAGLPVAPTRNADEELLFGCPTGALAHAVSLRLDASPREIAAFRADLLANGPDALLPCGTCRAGAVFPIFE